MSRRGQLGDTDPAEFDTWLEHLLQEDMGDDKLSLESMGKMDAMRGFLDDRSLLSGTADSREAATQGLWQAVEKRFAWGEAGVRPFLMKAQTGGQLRFGIQGMRGSFGFERARQIWEDRIGNIFPF